MFWSEHESQRLIVGCMRIKQERIKSMDFRTCTRQKAIHVLVSAVFANNSRVLQQWSTNIENTHIKACVHHEGRMPYTAWSDKHLQVLF